MKSISEGKKSFNLKIFIVENGPAAQEVTKILLDQLGCHFDFASTGEEAISADSQKYHMILLDIFLPDTNGFDIAQNIRRDELYRKSSTRIPIIAYTACGEEIKEGCITAGFDDFLFKPASVDDFKRLIQRLPKTQ